MQEWHSFHKLDIYYSGDIMSNLINYIKENYKIIIGTILIYQLLMTIFFFSPENLVILAAISLIVAGYIIVLNFKDSFTDFFKK